MPHLVRDEPADGVEFAVRQLHAKSLVDAFDRGIAIDAVAAIGQREDVALVLGAVKLVFDVADDLLEHVLNRDQAGHSAELVDHDGQVVAVATKVSQQIVEPFAFWNENGRAQQGAQIELGRALQLEQVLGQQDANDVFFLPLVDRKA